MKKLSRELFKAAAGNILNNGRELDKLYYSYYFDGGSREDFLLELKKYQNADGGFGGGLELDFQLPLSSPLTTSKAMQYLVRMDDNELSLEMIKAGVEYLEKSYDANRRGWYAVSEEVNNYPHAPWWHWNPEEGMTVIDKHWGNPSAELIGYLYRYRQYVTALDVEQLVDYALRHLNGIEEYLSFHEIYCYLALSQMLPEETSGKMIDSLYRAVQQLVSLDRGEWEDYTARPLDFISGPDSCYFGITQKAVADNLDYLVEQLERDRVITPNWEWSDYNQEWQEARKKWRGLLTLKGLITLDKFGRIEAGE